MALCFVKAECKLKGAREGTLGWECNCYKYMALCIVKADNGYIYIGGGIVTTY